MTDSVQPNDEDDPRWHLVADALRLTAQGITTASPDTADDDATRLRRIANEMDGTSASDVEGDE